MLDTAEQTEQPNKPSFGSDFWSGFWFTSIFGMSASVLRDFVFLPLAWILAGLLATCVSYFALPNPKKVSFVKFFVIAQVGVLIALVAIWFVPRQLREIMPEFWAYALPALVLINAIYFVPPLDGSKRGLWSKYFLASVVFAAFFGWLMS